MTIAIWTSSTQSSVAVATTARRAIDQADVCELAAVGFSLLLLDVEQGEAVEQQMSDDVALDTLVKNGGVHVKVRGDLLDVTHNRHDQMSDINSCGSGRSQAGTCTYDSQTENYDRWIAGGPASGARCGDRELGHDKPAGPHVVNA